MSASLFVRCVRLSVLALLATTAAGWGLSRNPANEDLQDIQILPQSSSGTPAVLRDHYWYNAKTDDGHHYYVDPETGTTTWTKPAALAWVPMNSEEHAREYYYNTITQESVWEKPESIAWQKIPMTNSELFQQQLLIINILVSLPAVITL
ncbi:MAG: hypothetical protein FRX49_02109 [Trebouxia sp. A1-2]|nr:MAG: hypothetical protein FRX49_02109 [Trebouxia sp. A1-2]